MPTPETKTAPSTALLNAEMVEVALDGGGTSLVMLKKLTIRQLYQFIEFISSEVTRMPELVALCADKDLEWVDSLTDEGFRDLAAKCIARNFQRAVKLGSGDITTANKLAPFLGRTLTSLKLQATVGPTSKGLSSAPAPSGSAEATGSDSSTSPSSASVSSSPSPSA